MTGSTAIELDAGGAVVVKRVGAADADRLRREGARLQRASHPGVVQVVASGPVDGGWELRTTFAGQPISPATCADVRQVAGVVAAVATTLADLHQMGIVHGRVEATHVVVGQYGRPVLCGFGPGNDPALPEDDVSALGALLVDLLGSEADAEPIPERRFGRRRTWSGWDKRSLLVLADQACAEPPTCRPSARRLAAAIIDAVPTLTLTATPTAHDDVPLEVPDEAIDPIERLRASVAPLPEVRSGRLPALALALAGSCLLVVGVLRFGGGAVRDEAVPLAHAAPTVSTIARPASPAVWSTASTLPESVVEAGGHRYRLGQAGDEVLVADWDCDGSEAPALLRPATGEVFVFAAWADRGSTGVRSVLVVPDAQALVSELTSSGCPTLAVRTSVGDLVPVSVAGSP